jgi:hypothetical protein
MRFPIWRLNQEFLRRSRNVSNHFIAQSFASSARVMTMDYNVTHDEINNEFYIELGQGNWYLVGTYIA